MSKILETLQTLITERESEIKAWFSGAYTNTSPFFYCSVDLRHSGDKIVPVDTNLFPAGFNNLSDQSRIRASKEISEYFEKYHPGSNNVLIIPENHTRNLFYLENINVLKSLVENAGYKTFVGSIENSEKITLSTESGKPIIIDTITRKNNKVYIQNENFTPDAIIVNNDFSSGAPDILRNLEQAIVPPVGMGWYKRRKTTHFESYAHVVNEFSQTFNIDPWLISTDFHRCGAINFKERKGLECVALGVEKVLHKIKKKYIQYGVNDEPYVFIKADSGTYGMGIMTARSGDEVMEINKKLRKKMSSTKEGVINSQVIIQEGVPTIDKIDEKSAEPLMYLIGCKPVGCTYRINENRDKYGNLNAPGMIFKNACEDDAETSGAKQLCDVQSLISKLSALAAARECYEPLWEI